MNLRDLCSTFSALRFPRLGEIAHPDRDAILGLRSTLRDGLVGEALLIDCFAHELALIEAGTRRRSLTPFHTDPEFGIRFAFGYWPPGHDTGAHEHTAWTISAVCHNQLRVATFDRAASYQRRALVAKNLFEAEDRAVGYILEPAIHAPMNPSRRWSLSMHVGSPRDGEPVGDFEPLEALAVTRRPDFDRHPYARAVRARLSRIETDLLVHVLRGFATPRTRELLRTCARLASSPTRAALRTEVPEAFAHRAAPRRLTRTHPDLRLTVEPDALDWKVIAETPFGPFETLRINADAREAFAYAAAAPSFEVRDLPGTGSDDERDAIADTLEDLGFFKEMAA